MTFMELLDEHNVEYRSSGHEHCRPGWVQLDCPGCTPNSKHFRLGYNLAGKYMNCWACGPKKSWTTLAEMMNIPVKKVASLLGEISQNGVYTEVEHRGTLALPSGIGPLQGPHKRYLKKRGYRYKQLQRLWGIQGIGNAGFMGWRIFIPITYRGATVSWTSRSISDRHERRYWSASPKQEVINHKEILYGEDYCRHAVVVCEGPFDVWRIGPGAVCTFGTGFKNSQVAKLAEYPVRVICYDSEDAAQKRADQLVDQLSPFEGETYNLILSGKDAGDSPQEEIDYIRRTFLNDDFQV